MTVPLCLRLGGLAFYGTTILLGSGSVLNLVNRGQGDSRADEQVRL